MRVKYEIGDKKFEISPYTTKQEKEILLLLTYEITDVDEFLRVLKFKSDYSLSDSEKKLILFKYRDISLGDVVNIRFKCDHCSSVFDSTLELNNFIIPSKRNDPHIKKLDKELTDDNLHEFVDLSPDEIDDLEIAEFENLLERVRDNQIQFDFIKKQKCLKCKKEKKFDVSDYSYILNIMSDDTLMTLYKAYNNLTFFGHYSKHDIDYMLPFERSIFLGLLTKTKEDLAK